jgi:hypothetical protein
MFRAQTNAFDDAIFKATDENLTSENWEYILVRFTLHLLQGVLAFLLEICYGLRILQIVEPLARPGLTGQRRMYATKWALRTQAQKMLSPP